MRHAFFVYLLGLALVGCRSDRAEQHLRNELGFFRSFVDVDGEVREVRRVLSQRNMTTAAVLKGPGFVALSAGTQTASETAVRIVTKRGVVLGMDGSLDAVLSPTRVALVETVSKAIDDLSLVGVAQLPKGLAVGCLRLFRVLGDGRIAEVTLDVGRFGMRACVGSLDTTGGRFLASVAWPALNAGDVPTLAVELKLAPVLLGREEEPGRRLSPVEGGAWLSDARRLFDAQRVAQAKEFSARHALGIARAAVALAEGREPSEQRATYLETVGRLRAGSPESAAAQDAVDHISRGWQDGTPVDTSDAGTADAAADTLVEPDAAAEDDLAGAQVILPEPDGNRRRGR